MEYFQLLPFHPLTFHFMVLFYYLSVWLCMKFLPWLSSSFFNPPPRLPWFILQFYYYTLQSRALSKASILQEQEGGISTAYCTCVWEYLSNVSLFAISSLAFLFVKPSSLLFLYHLSVSLVVCVCEIRQLLQRLLLFSLLSLPGMLLTFCVHTLVVLCPCMCVGWYRRILIQNSTYCRQDIGSLWQKIVIFWFKSGEIKLKRYVDIFWTRKL